MEGVEEMAATGTIVPDSSDQTIIVTGDHNLKPENIKKNIEIFGVMGKYDGSDTPDNTRWHDNRNGTVTDLTTGLIWLKKADWGGTRRLYESSVWTENAYDRVSLLKSGAKGAELRDGSVEGHWRLPTLSELKGLTSGDEAVFSSQKRAFTGVESGYYWSSSTYADNTAHGWVVGLCNGSANSCDKTFDHHVWPVRGGQ